MSESEITHDLGKTINPTNPTENTDVNDLHPTVALSIPNRFELLQNGPPLTHPLWTVSLSEGGFEKVYQGLIIVPQWQVSLAAGVSWQVEIKLSFERLGDSKVNCAHCQASDQVPI